MTNYEKMMAELKNMSVEEFAKTRIFVMAHLGFITVILGQRTNTILR